MTMAARGLAKCIEEIGELTFEIAQMMSVVAYNLAHQSRCRETVVMVTDGLQAEAADATAAIEFVARTWRFDRESYEALARQELTQLCHKVDFRWSRSVCPAYTRRLHELGDLSRAVGKLAQTIGKRLAYYHTDAHPDGGPSLDKRLMQHAATARAAIAFACEAWPFDRDRYDTRVAKKLALFEEWEAEIDNNQDGVDRSRSSVEP